jgi:hypothetical protein
MIAGVSEEGAASIFRAKEERASQFGLLCDRAYVIFAPFTLRLSLHVSVCFRAPSVYTSIRFPNLISFRLPPLDNPEQSHFIRSDPVSRKTRQQVTGPEAISECVPPLLDAGSNWQWLYLSVCLPT